jgi:hypothetical protein
MKEYVEVTDTLLRKTPELKKLFDASLAYVGSLKPKPTTRKKTATKTPAMKSSASKKAAKKKLPKQPKR